MWRCWASTGLVGLACALGCAEASAAEDGGAQIWFAPNPSLSDGPTSNGFLRLFQAQAPWKEAAARTRVFQLYSAYVLGVPQDLLDRIVQDLQRRHIALAVEAGALNIDFKPPPPCGGRGLVEGYATPAVAREVSRKIQAAGGTIDFLAMDEPLWYGHFFAGYPGKQPGCQSPVSQLLAQARPTLEEYRRHFPGIRVGDIEPANLALRSGWQQALREWADGIRLALGQPLAFVHLDVPRAVAGSTAATRQFATAVAAFQRENLVGALGLIYDGTPQDPNNAAWLASARRLMRELEVDQGLAPDTAILQSWHRFPDHMLPETDPQAFTSLILYYAGGRFREAGDDR